MYGYVSVPLGEVADFRYGYTDKAKDTGDVRFLRITDIMDNGYLNPEGAKYLDISEENKKYLVEEGSLLMARTGATYGKTMYVPEKVKGVFASFLIQIMLDNEILDNRYYWHFAQSHSYWEQANKLVTKGGQPQFNSNAVCNVMMSIPSLAKQREVVEILDRFDALCNDIESGLPAEIEARTKQYEYYRDKLLSFKRKDTA